MCPQTAAQDIEGYIHTHQNIITRGASCLFTRPPSVYLTVSYQEFLLIYTPAKRVFDRFLQRVLLIYTSTKRFWPFLTTTSFVHWHGRLKYCWWGPTLTCLLRRGSNLHGRLTYSGRILSWVNEAGDLTPAFILSFSFSRLAPAKAHICRQFPKHLPALLILPIVRSETYCSS